VLQLWQLSPMRYVFNLNFPIFEHFSKIGVTLCSSKHSNLTATNHTMSSHQLIEQEPSLPPLASSSSSSISSAATSAERKLTSNSPIATSAKGPTVTFAEGSSPKVSGTKRKAEEDEDDEEDEEDEEESAEDEEDEASSDEASSSSSSVSAAPSCSEEPGKWSSLNEQQRYGIFDSVKSLITAKHADADAQNNIVYNDQGAMEGFFKEVLRKARIVSVGAYTAKIKLFQQWYSGGTSSSASSPARGGEKKRAPKKKRSSPSPVPVDVTSIFSAVPKSENPALKGSFSPCSFFLTFVFILPLFLLFFLSFQLLRKLFPEVSR